MQDILNGVAKHSSETERRADEAERICEKMKKAQYMEKHIGETMEAVISGVTGWGFYAELPNTVEGLVPVSGLRSDYFIFDEENSALGRRTHRQNLSAGRNGDGSGDGGKPVCRNGGF